MVGLAQDKTRRIWGLDRLLEELGTCGIWILDSL
jgi:hypothetical protein